MRHLTVSGFGDFLGVHGNRLIVRNGDNVILETALSRLRTIRIDKSVSLSSNLILACAARGIRIYFLDWKGVGVVEVSGMHRHAVVGVRKSQFECLKSLQAQLLAKGSDNKTACEDFLNLNVNGITIEVHSDTSTELLAKVLRVVANVK